MMEVFIPGPNGTLLGRGWVTNRIYFKQSWTPWESLYSHGTKYLLIEAWNYACDSQGKSIILKDIVDEIHLIDMISKREYIISIMNATKHGRNWTPENSGVKQSGFVNYRVPNNKEYWEYRKHEDPQQTSHPVPTLSRMASPEDIIYEM